jgi:GNAT superfamily N-acetyltransferase
VVPPVAPEVAGVYVRNFQFADDMRAWLELRDRAMSDQTPNVRSWSESDFHSEMTSKPWWRDDRTWLAIAGELRLPETSDTASYPATRSSPASTERVVGAVTLALREGTTTSVPVVHWLLVDPEWRRRGIGRLLMYCLERSVWETGQREIEIETHSRWAAAVAFYQSIGYAPVPARRDSPR